MAVRQRYTEYEPWPARCQRYCCAKAAQQKRPSLLPGPPRPDPVPPSVTVRLTDRPPHARPAAAAAAPHRAVPTGRCVAPTRTGRLPAAAAGSPALGYAHGSAPPGEVTRRGVAHSGRKGYRAYGEGSQGGKHRLRLVFTCQKKVQDVNLKKWENITQFGVDTYQVEEIMEHVMRANLRI